MDRSLYLQVYPTGLKRWVVKFSIGNKRPEVTLPRPYGTTGIGDMSLAEARLENERIQKLAKSGIDFRDNDAHEKQKEKETKAIQASHNKTFKELFEDWVTNGVSRVNNNSELKRMFHKDVLPLLGRKRVADITEVDIRTLLRKIIDDRDANRIAVRVYEDLSQLFKWAEERQPWRRLLIEGIPTNLIDITRIISPEYDEPKGFRSRYLKEEEIQELRSIFEITTIDYKCAPYKVRRKMKIYLAEKYQIGIWICLATLCRVGELLMTEWKNVNLESGEWFIPKEVSKKNRGPNNDFLIFLSPFALAQFKKLYAFTGTTPWCFPNSITKATNHIGREVLTKEVNNRQTMFKEHQSDQRTYDNSLVLSNGQNGDWTPHDLRRTGATMMQKLQVLPDMIDHCQNHKVKTSNKARRHYQLYEYANEKKEAWCKWGEYIEHILG